MDTRLKTGTSPRSLSKRTRSSYSFISFRALTSSYIDPRSPILFFGLARCVSHGDNLQRRRGAGHACIRIGVLDGNGPSGGCFAGAGAGAWGCLGGLIGWLGAGWLGGADGRSTKTLLSPRRRTGLIFSLFDSLFSLSLYFLQNQNSIPNP